MLTTILLLATIHWTFLKAPIEAFARDEDVHELVASQVYAVGRDEVTSDMRRHAKAVNFGIIYGQSPFGLAKSINISQDEAAKFIETYFAKYPGLPRNILGRQGWLRNLRMAVIDYDSLLYLSAYD